MENKSFEVGHCADKKKEQIQMSKRSKFIVPDSQLKDEKLKAQYFKDNQDQLIFQSIKSFKRYINDYRDNKIKLEAFTKVTNLTKESAHFIKDLDTQELELNYKKLLKVFSNINNSYLHEKKLFEIGQMVEQNQPEKVEKLDINFSQKLDWQNMPKYLVPEYTCFPLYKHLQLKEWKRAAYKIDHLRRKRRQIDFYYKLINDKIQERKQQNNPVKHIVDFAGGRGDLSLVMAHFFPDIKFSLIDLKEQTINQAKLKKKLLKLDNINVIHGDIFDFSEKFDFAIGLHACGGLIDIIIQKCLEQEKFPSMIICTCCFGKIQQFQDLYQYPRSIDVKNLNEQKQQEFFQICNFAECETLITEKFKYEYQQQQEFYRKDHVLQNIQVEDEIFKKYKQNRLSLSQNCKYFINKDRIDYIMLNVKELNIKPKLVELPVEITPKNQMLII